MGVGWIANGQDWQSGEECYDFQSLQPYEYASVVEAL